jgi:hypothetical protein
MNKTPHLKFPDFMAYVNVPKDLNKIKNKALFNLTVRQLVCFGSAAVVGIPVYLLTRHTIGGTGAALLMIGLMLPLFFLAMYEKDGQPAEKIVRNIIRTKFYFPGKRPYKTECLYETLEKEGNTDAKQANSTTAATARKYQAGKSKPR